MLLCCSNQLGADQIVLTAVADTSLWQRETNHNLGGAPFLPAGTVGSDGNFRRTRILLKFDLAGSLPPGAIVESASVYLRVVRAPDPEKLSRNSTFTGRRILKDWGEGDKIYTDPQTPMTSTLPATAGEATWDDRFYGDPAATWAVPGGDFTDNDFAEASDFDFFTSPFADVDETAGLNAEGLGTLRAWIADPASNFGWVVKSELETAGGTARHFAASEYSILEHRPQLIITYSVLGPTAPVIESIARTGDSVTVDYSVEAGVVYLPQFKSTVDGALWTDLPLQGPLGAASTLHVTNDVTGINERYYRVVIPGP